MERVLDKGVLDERVQYSIEMAFKQAWSHLGKISLDVFSKPIKQSKLKLTSIGNTRAFKAAARPYLSMGPEIFTWVPGPLEAQWPDESQAILVEEAPKRSRSGRKITKKVHFDSKL